MILILVIVLIVLMALNYPVIDYLHRVHTNETICKCSGNWMLDYLYYYLLFWYALSAIEIFTILLLPKFVNHLLESSLYYPMTVVSGVSYSFYIIVLWSYIESIKINKCSCSHISKHRYVKTYAWFIFLLYIILVSYVGLALSSIGKKEALRRGKIHA
jgi:hypothetical protein